MFAVKYRTLSTSMYNTLSSLLSLLECLTENQKNIWNIIPLCLSFFRGAFKLMATPECGPFFLPPLVVPGAIDDFVINFINNEV